MVMKKKENKRLERLPDSELAVMRLIWEADEAVGTGYLSEILGDEKGWTRSTTQVLLARLEEKKFVTCRKEGRYKKYTPLIPEEVYRRSETKTFLEQFYNSSSKGLIAALVQEEEWSEEDIQEIIDVIQKDADKKS